MVGGGRRGRIEDVGRRKREFSDEISPKGLTGTDIGQGKGVSSVIEWVLAN